MNREQNILNIINEKLDNTFSPNGKKVFLLLLVVAIIAGVFLVVSPNGENKTVEENQNSSVLEANLENPELDPQKEVANQEAEIEVELDAEEPVDAKMVSMTVEDFGRSNPFLPSSESFGNMRKYGFELMAPPDTIATEEAEAVKVVATKVSGIMFEPNNPSAILNIDGEDYLVRSGDYINNYRVLAIDKDMVTVQLGVNVHKARVGEMLAGSEINHNTIYDLENKFGGSKR